MWRQVLDWLGFGSTFAFAAATYALFLFLDKNASVAATDAISKWLRTESYKEFDIKGAVFNIFNIIYTSSLFSF
jgi:hypothetical protein